MELNETNVPLNPVVSVPMKADVASNLTKQLKKPPTVISPEHMETLKRKHLQNSMPTTSTMSLNTIERFDTANEMNNTASPREESILRVLESLKKFEKYKPHN